MSHPPPPPPVAIFEPAPSPPTQWVGNPPPRDALEGGEVPPQAPFRLPSLCPDTVSLTVSASFSGICNRQ